MLFMSYRASSCTTSVMQRFDNHCESHSALEVVYNAPVAIRYSVTRAFNILFPFCTISDDLVSNLPIDMFNGTERISTF